MGVGFKGFEQGHCSKALGFLNPEFLCGAEGFIS